MAQKGYGNFAFLYDINAELYEQLYAAERNARINYREFGRSARDILEEYVNLVIRANKLQGYIPSELSLSDKLSKLSSDIEMREAGYLSSAQTLEDKPLLPKMERVSCTLENGKSEKMDYIDLLRRFGNSCSHKDIKPWNPKICYNNVISCLRGLHLLLQRHYSSRISKGKWSFDEDRIPIGKYVIYDSAVPADSARSKCVKEYWGYRPDKDGDPVQYVLIRTYDRNSTDGTFMLRNQDCFTEASRNSIAIVPEGMAQLEELTAPDSRGNEQYIICYKFNQKPHPLNQELLRQLDLEQRISLCRKIVNCLNNLHCSATPIFHRMLNYESVYVCHINGQWHPYIVKFDYAKIVTTKEIGTVYMSALESQNYLRKKGRQKYLPPEWLQIEDGSVTPDWAKVDIYALGVLMMDILKGEITGSLVSLDELEDIGVPDLILDVLESMLIESPEKRVTMQDVKDLI